MRLVCFILATCLFFSQCKVNKNKSSSNPIPVNSHNGKPSSSSTAENMIYRASETKAFDLVHTRLDLRFDYTKRQVIGIATISVKPHFYHKDTLVLDAIKFLIKRVAQINGTDTLPLLYRYDDSHLMIDVSRNNNCTVFIDYIARPEETDLKGSAAITDAQGLYFINPDRSDPDKPRQIWSQGETQANSCWFPTIDAPNQKMTQEILLTVDAKDVTLSNGELILSKDHPDGTRTDYWKQSLPHAPYLTMIAIGEFAVVKDFWRDNMEVNYYVEPKFKPFARLIFGHTPEMLEFFSKKLGVDYPWEKFSQIVVRDFVSGAMENTTAVLHGESLQHNAREHLDNTLEDVISHELFHHWFGDLVTCESWSNIPLNESFATYGEYLWNEYKYGRLKADQELDEKLNSYLNGPANYSKIPIRFQYKNQEDMFDNVSYQKGGRILHMLRYQVGDSAFFTSLKTYLNDNKFSTVEIHQLRLAFEKVTGEDLNWFFNQWFLKAGHPVLDYCYSYSSDMKSVKLVVNQTQDSMKFGIYRLPICIDIYGKESVTRKKVELNQKSDTFSFALNEPIVCMNVDAEKVLLAKIIDHQGKDALTQLFRRGPLYADKWFALRNYAGNTDSISGADSNLLVMADCAFEHPYAGIRNLGIDILKGASKHQLKFYEFRLRQMAKHDSSADIRSNVLELLKTYDAAAFENLFTEMINDSSYHVAASALLGLKAANPARAMKVAGTMEKESNGTLLTAISDIYSSSNDTGIYSFFIPAMKRAGAFRYNILQDYWEYTMMQMPMMQMKCLDDLYANIQAGKQDIYSVYFNSQFARQMQKQNNELSVALEAALKKQKKGSEQEQNIIRAIADLKLVNEKLVLFWSK